MPSCDVAVIGLGIMGSAALHALTAQHVDALGFDPSALGEKRGSSHGSSRIYRRFNFENPAYTALSMRAYERWRALEDASGERILLPTPLLEAGVPGSSLVRGSRAAAGAEAIGAKAKGPRHGKELKALFPTFQLPDDWEVVLQESAGILRADVALRLLRKGAPGRVINQKVALNRTASEIVITAADGTRYSAKTVIIAAGAWVTDFEPRLRDYIRVTRQVVGWFTPATPALVRHGSFPLFILDTPQGMIYGFPDFDGKGVKAASHDHGREITQADLASQNGTAADLAGVQEALARYIPAAAGPLIAQEVCLYTNTKAGDVDGSKAEEFILDRLPDDPRVIIASLCSGHGFKFASAVGDILAGMATDQSIMPPAEFTLSRYSRFASIARQ